MMLNSNWTQQVDSDKSKCTVHVNSNWTQQVDSNKIKYTVHVTDTFEIDSQCWGIECQMSEVCSIDKLVAANFPQNLHWIEMIHEMSAFIIVRSSRLYFLQWETQAFVDITICHKLIIPWYHKINVMYDMLYYMLGM